RRWGGSNWGRGRLAAVGAGRYRNLAPGVGGAPLGPHRGFRPPAGAAVARARRGGARAGPPPGPPPRPPPAPPQQPRPGPALVCNSGAIVKDPTDHRTLWRADFDPQLAADVLELFQRHNQPAVVFTDRTPDRADFIVAAFPTGQAAFDDYVRQNHEHAEINA